MNKKTKALTTAQYKEIIQTMREGFCGCRPNDRVATALVLEGIHHFINVGYFMYSCTIPIICLLRQITILVIGILSRFYTTSVKTLYPFYEIPVMIIFICIRIIDLIPDNIKLFFIPPYTPEMNPIEQIWKQLRKMAFRNEVFSTLAKVVDRLCDVICALSADTIRSITARKWIASCFN